MLKTVLRDCQWCEGRGIVKVIDHEALRELRENSGITLRKFATKVGVSAAYISDIELGRRRCTEQIAKAYEKL